MTEAEALAIGNEILLTAGARTCLMAPAMIRGLREALSSPSVEAPVSTATALMGIELREDPSIPHGSAKLLDRSGNVLVTLTWPGYPDSDGPSAEIFDA